MNNNNNNLMRRSQSSLTRTSSIRKSNRRRPRTGYNRNIPRNSGATFSSAGAEPLKVSVNEVIERGIPGFSMLRYTCDLNYYLTTDLPSGAGTVGSYVFSANGLYDPDITGTGHQPMGFDQLMVSFEHYTVVSAKMTVIFRNSTLYPNNIGISLNAGPTPVTSVVQLVENGQLVRNQLAGAFSASGGGSDNIKQLQIPINISKFGSVPNLLDNPDYKGTIASNPVEQSYFHVHTWNVADSTVQNVACDIFVTYRAIFTEPRKQSISLRAKIAKLVLQESKTA